MRIILNANEGASTLDLVSMVRCASFALANGLGPEPGAVMAVTQGSDLANTFGVVRTKTGVSVWAPDRLGTHQSEPSA